MSFSTTISIALITGGLFFKLPLTSDGVFTRGGVLFILLLFNSLSTFAELASQMQSRPILARQLSFAMFRPAALPMAQILADVPLSVPRMTIFIVIVYFMTGLRTSCAFPSFNWHAPNVQMWKCGNVVVVTDTHVCLCHFFFFGEQV